MSQSILCKSGTCKAPDILLYFGSTDHSDVTKDWDFTQPVALSVCTDLQQARAAMGNFCSTINRTTKQNRRFPKEIILTNTVSVMHVSPSSHEVRGQFDRLDYPSRDLLFARTSFYECRMYYPHIISGSISIGFKVYPRKRSLYSAWLIGSDIVVASQVDDN